MAMLVHLATESMIPRIKRNGIRRLRRARGSFPGGIFAVPVTRSFYASHQWLRELKRRNRGPIAGVYFRIPDGEQVYVGHYNEHHQWMTAAEAVSLFSRADDPFGWEIIIPRRIDAIDIHRVRKLPQVVGWRYSTKAKGKPPFCNCQFCNRGEYGWNRRRTNDS
jgi:hypothetical protein